MYLVNVFLMTPKIDWDFCCGICGVNNFCRWNFILGLLYQSWVYLVNHLLMISKVNWNFCCGIHGVENLCPWNFSFGFIYQTWLYLVNIFSWPRKLVGFFAVAQTALRICVPGDVISAFVLKLVVTG